MIVPVLLTALALILAYIGSRRELSRLQLAFVALFFLAGAAGVVFQDLSTRLAVRLHVGRGTDLMLYFSVLLGVLIAANFYFRFRQNERIMAEIVRQLAILGARQPDAPPQAGRN